MSEVQKALFGLVFAAQLLLLLTTLRHGHLRKYAAFLSYVVMNLVHGVVMYWLFLKLDIHSSVVAAVATGSQALVLCTRAAAVSELCRDVLSEYRGIWALGWRLLAGAAGVLVLYSVLIMRGHLEYSVTRAETGLELTITTVLALLFLFTWNYQVPVNSSARLLAIGFFLFSYASAMNDFVLSRFLGRFVDLWAVIGGFSYLASVMLWIRALWQKEMAAEKRQIATLPAEVYGRVIPEVNLRLQFLNHRLSRFFHTEPEHS